MVLVHSGLPYAKKRLGKLSAIWSRALKDYQPSLSQAKNFKEHLKNRLLAYLGSPTSLWLDLSSGCTLLNRPTQRADCLNCLRLPNDVSCASDSYEISHVQNLLMSGNTCCQSVQNLLSSSLLSRNMKIKVHRHIILPVFLYGCETWSFILREEHNLRVPQKYQQDAACNRIYYSKVY